MNKEDAYQILHLPAESSPAEVEERYLLLLKKYKSDDSMERLASIHAAYRFLKEREEVLTLQKINEVQPEKQGWRRTIEHIFLYYKVHAFLIVVGVLLAGGMLFSAFETWNEYRIESNLPPNDLQIAVYGDFREVKTESIERDILTLFPEWERVTVELITSPTEINSELHVAEQHRSKIELQKSQADIFITDRMNYDALKEQDLFLPLPAAFIPPDMLNYASQSEHSFLDNLDLKYGMNVASHDFFSHGELQADNGLFLALHSRGNNTTNAESLMKKLQYAR